MMQEECDDIYGMQSNAMIDSGCCLLCEDAIEGCLCYECMCRKCYWYISPEEWDGEKGRCGLAQKRKEEKNG